MARGIDSMDGSALRNILTTCTARIEIGPDSITLSLSRTALASHLDITVECD
jgi:hypothetical protein